MANYARYFREAVNSRPGYELNSFPGEPEGSTWWQKRRSLRRQLSAFPVSSFALVHAELSFISLAEFYLLEAISSRFPRLPLLATVHDPPLLTHAPAQFLPLIPIRGTDPWQWRFWDLVLGRRLLARVRRALRGLVVFSREGRQRLEAEGHTETTKIFVIPQVVSWPWSARPELPAARFDTRRFHFLGNLSSAKGVHILLDALALLEMDPGNPARLVISGLTDHPFGGTDGCDQATRAKLQNAIARGTLALTGYLPDEVIPGYAEQERLPIFVYPYLGTASASVSAALLTAMYWGQAIITTPTRGHAEEIIQGETGWMVPPGKPEPLAEAMQQLAGDRRLRLRLGEGAQAHLRDHHAPAQVAARMANIYDELVS